MVTGLPGEIRAGDRIVVDDTPRVVLGGSGTLDRFDGDDGTVEDASVAELVGSGRLRQRWQAEGLPALVDRRVTRRRSPAGRADPSVAGAMEQAIAEATDDSSRTATFIVWRTRQILAEKGQDGTEPSRATMFRLFSRLSAGRHTTGSAATRRGLAGRPQRMFSQAHPAAPGELMEI